MIMDNVDKDDSSKKLNIDAKNPIITYVEGLSVPHVVRPPNTVDELSPDEQTTDRKSVV